MRLARRRGLLFAVAVAAYLPGFWWGAPTATGPDRVRAWGVDDEAPLGMLGHIQAILSRRPETNTNPGYPMMESFMVGAASAPYLLYLRLTGGMHTPTPTYPFGLADPAASLRILSLLAHLVSVILGAGIVVAAFEAARILWGEQEGLWAAMFTLLMYPMYYYSRTANVDVPALFFIAWAFVAFARVIADGLSVKRAAVLGALVGLAVGTKETSFAAFLAIPVGVLFLPVAEAESSSPWRVRLRASVVGALGSLVVYALASGLAADPAWWIRHIGFARYRTAEVATTGVAWQEFFPMTLAGNLRLAQQLGLRLADAMTLPGVVAGVAGIVVSWRREPRTAWLALCAAAYLVVLFVAARAADLRYVMPAAFVLCAFAGATATRIFNIESAGPRRLLGVAVIGALVLGGLRAIDLTAAMVRDSRYDAARWIAAHATAGDTLEFFGREQQLPPLPAWLATRQTTTWSFQPGDTPDEPAGAARVRQIWNERRPRFITIIPDGLGRPGDPFSAECPAETFTQLEDGSLGYVRAAFFQTPDLIPWVHRPAIDYPVVNPPIRIYVPRADSAATAPAG